VSDMIGAPVQAKLDASYAAMAADLEREAEALAWIESAPDDGLDDLDDEDEDWSWLRPETPHDARSKG
jgi:hypothetical protein